MGIGDNIREQAEPKDTASRPWAGLCGICERFLETVIDGVKDPW